MTNKDLFQEVKTLNLPLGKYALFGSAPMCIRELKDCRDIDLIVQEELWQEYKKNPDWKYQVTENGVEHLTKDNIEIWHNWLPWYRNVNQLIEGAEVIDNLPFVRLEKVLGWKKAWGREKDLKDVEIIEKFRRG